MFTIAVLVLGLVAWQGKVTNAEPMGTAWTYQGRLMDANDTADGFYDFQFKLFDGPNTLTAEQMGTTININDLDVIDGYFTVELDYGRIVFNGDARWLQIAVRPGGSAGSFTTLVPRQKITPVPYTLCTNEISKGAVVILHFDEGSGNIAYDSSGHGNDCILQEGITNDDWVDGKFGKAIDSDGASNEYGECPNSLSFDDELTFSAWINADSLGQKAIISKMGWIASRWHGAFLLIQGDNKLALILANGTAQSTVISPSAITTDQWYYVAGTYDGSQAALYVDGQLVDSKATNLFDDPGPSYPLRVNDWPGWTGGRFDGTMDEIIVYRRALSSDEIAELPPHDAYFKDGTFSGNLSVIGDVGIGTANPAEKLEVAGTIHSTTGGFKFPDGTTQTTAPSPAWYLTGNSGTSPGTNFLGTTDNVALELHANGQRALRIEPHSISPNLIIGYSGNIVTSGVEGATIGGGGASGNTNRVTDDYGTVGGGRNNRAGNDTGTTSDAPWATIGGGHYNTAGNALATVGGGFDNTASGNSSTIAGGNGNIASNIYATVGGGLSNTASGMYATVGGGAGNIASGGSHATVPGGQSNTAQGSHSFAAGRRAKANHDGSFVWADSTNADFASTANDQFLIRAGGNVGIGTTSPQAELHVTTNAGQAGMFEIDNTSDTSTVLEAKTNGKGLAGMFEISNPINNSNVLKATTNGGGGAGRFQINNSSNNATTLSVSTNGSGTAVTATNTGTGEAGSFSTNNTTSTSPALHIETWSLGNAVEVTSMNNGASLAALDVSTRGTGSDSWAGRFIGLSSSSKGVYISAPTGQPGLEVAFGTKNAVVATSQGARALYTEEATEVWFTDYGFGRLQAGSATIEIDSLFAETINLGEPYHVFVQLNDTNCEGVAVVDKTDSSFKVVELRDGRSNAEFSYRIVAKRRGYEQTRLAYAPEADNDLNLYPSESTESVALNKSTENEKIEK